MMLSLNSDAAARRSRVLISRSACAFAWTRNSCVNCSFNITEKVRICSCDKSMVSVWMRTSGSKGKASTMIGIGVGQTAVAPITRTSSSWNGSETAGVWRGSPSRRQTCRDWRRGMLVACILWRYRLIEC